MPAVATKHVNPNTFESVRAFGRLLASPGDPTWDIELTLRTAQVPYILHISCSVHNTLFMPRIAQEILKILNLEFVALGGPENCCGAIHEDLERLEDLQHEVATKTLLMFKRARPKTVLSVCARCIRRFNTHQVKGNPVQYAHVADLLVEHLDVLAARMRPVPRRVVVHHHIGNAARPQDDLGTLLTILKAIPGLEILPAPRAGFRETSCPTIKSMTSGVGAEMFAEAKALGADTVVAPYQACYRRNVKMQLEYGIETHHWLSLLAMALDIPFYEPWKELRLLNDVDGALNALRPKMDALGYRAETIRPFIERVIYNI
ncbi:MAG: (Fe-S)-binding protein [Burkholderiales bacterium]|nr:(Fe-S)-binding protein [Burkholderiales bacterium]